MTDRFQRHLASSGLIPDGARVLVAYSGGADSTALLHLLHGAGFDVVAAHLHHGQRAEAEDELRRCQEFADGLGVTFVSGRADVPKISAETKVGLEEAGRNARYEFLRQAAFRLECERIATGHTRTDRVESVLLNLARGTGIGGLAGIPAVRDKVVRPLLPFSRAETRRYCEEHTLWFHDDPANQDVEYSRTRVRLRVLPELSRIHPDAEAAIERLANLAAEEDSFLDSMAAAGLEQAETPLNGPLGFLTRDLEVALRADVLTSLPPVLLRRGLRLVASVLGGTLDSNQNALIVRGLRGDAPGSVTCEGGRIAFEWNADQLHVRRLDPAEPFRYRLEVPGETLADSFGWQIAAEDARFDGTPQARDGLTVLLEPSRIRGELHFRSIGDGDRMRPLGFEGSRKVSDLVGEKGLTNAARRRLPLVCDLVGPLWLPGVCLDARAAAAAPGPALRLTFAPIA